MVSRVFLAPVLGSVRLAVPEDASFILGLVNESMAKNFRIENTRDIIRLIEDCVLSIIQLDTNNAIVGFLAAKDSPLIPSLHPQAWEEYIWTKYKTVELNSRNTLFIHLLCWDQSYSREVVDNLLRSMFMHDAYLMYIAMVKPLVNYQLLVPGQSRSEAMFRRVTVMERGVPGDTLPLLCIADRAEVCPRLRIRRAVEEDNDDLVPIIERHSKRLRDLYGEFYISELISRHPESERVLLVCEHKELAVGLMILNTEINFDGLEESFELSPFSGLRHLVDNQQVRCQTNKDMLDSTCCLFDSGVNASTTNLNTRVTSDIAFDTVNAKKTKVVAWISEEETTPEQDLEAYAQTPITTRDVIDILENDEDELEFDIVNIDTDLLRVPKMISYDSYCNGVASYITKMLEGASPDLADDKSVADKEKYKKPSTVSLNQSDAMPETVHYLGPPNAFLLEVFAMHPDYDERYGFDMLEVAYELFPNRDYCVLCLPSNHAAFPLLEHFTLVTPFGTRKTYINESLYVAHVNSVRENVSLRAGEAYDIPAMNDILEHAPRKQALLDLFHKSLTSSTLDSYVLLNQNQPVGVVVVGPLEDATAIRTQYGVEAEPRRPGTDGTILAGIMSPVVEPHARWFIRDLMRHSNYKTLFWLSRLLAKGDANPCRNLMSLAGWMTPVRPRRIVPNVSGNKDLNKIFRDVSTPFALWVLERPLTSLPKVDVNNGIVVIGASRTGLAFLETLVMGPTSSYLTFTNVTLISEHGLPTVAECLRAADTCVPRNGKYTDRYLKCVPFFFYVDVISAVVTGINRKKKCVYFKNGGMKYYDELVITCGQQFQHPEYLAESLSVVKEQEKGKTCERMLMDDPRYQPHRVPSPPDVPENVMIINSLCDANLGLRKLLRMVSEAKHDEALRLSAVNRVVVYGDCIEAYSCMAALLELGLCSEKIVYVEPFPSDNPSVLRVNCFNDEVVDDRVQAAIAKLGIRVHRRSRFTGWQIRGSRVVTLNFMSPLHAFRLPCFVLFYYGLKAIDLNAFRAINECGLVYDGGLVVGPTFDTNDPHIYAAGTCVRYSRRLYARHRLHRYYCSEDIGEALAKLFLRKMDPFVMGDSDMDPCPSDVLPRYNSSLLKWHPVQKFESPIIQSATFPGPLYYMTIRKPGPDVPMEIKLSLPHQGHTLTTNKLDNYCRLKLNVLHRVESITCLSHRRFSYEVIAATYGKHEAFFDKLLARYMMNQIDDLLEYFVQPWMAALYQETFDDLLVDIYQQEVGTVYDIVQSHFSLFDAGKIEPKSSDSKSSSSSSRTGCHVPSCGFGPKDAQNLGTFQSVLDRYIAQTSFKDMVNVKNVDIPSECGQSEGTRNEARGFWNCVGGEHIVHAHLARYLDQNSVCNPNYATYKPELI